MMVGPGYCPVQWYRKEYQISYFPIDFILKNKKFRGNSVSLFSQWPCGCEVFGDEQGEKMCTSISVSECQSKYRKSNIPFLQEKNVKNPFLRKPWSNGIYLDLGKLSKEHRTGFIHNLSQDLSVGLSDGWECTSLNGQLHDSGDLVALLGP